MIVAEMVDYLFEEVNSGRLKMSDQIPDEILHGGENLTVTDYIAGKYNIKRGGDTDGQDRE